MQPFVRHAAVLATLVFSLACAHAALKPGDAAPTFSTEAARGGKTFSFQLGDALKRGPVVLYFFPKAFTQGCTVEANLFAEASERFAALGATVVGISADNIDTLKRFSVEACRDKFAVAADASAKVIKAYDAQSSWSADMSDRISYVIGKDGRIAFTHHGPDPQAHVQNTLKAVEALGGPGQR
ncbi:peroxiredoxin [Pseudorhodoferax sp. Leaf267]|uniref:peroxiredoxin n=1 Tax=Pseudorhodoferax sp. Leaf267 TaxID=1736316 RepID=UPI0019104442|nr:peroxiredoxin [Pseudorhodoferax sp. Leaf267]